MAKETLRCRRPSWPSEMLLPGYPILEARLRGTTPGLVPFEEGMAPSRHFLRGLGTLKRLGIAEPRAAVFSGSVQPP